MQLHYMHTDVSPEAVKGNKESGTASFLKLFTWWESKTNTFKYEQIPVELLIT